MRLHLITAVAIAALFHTCICDEVAGYSDLANDFSTPLSSTTNTSPNLVRSIFSRQTQWCTAGNPYVLCPTPRTCCSARDNCTPTGCCPKIAETCGGRSCYVPGAVCCGNIACQPGGVCKRSPSGANVCCRSATDVACDGYCCQTGTTCAGGGLCQRPSISTSRFTSTLRSRSISTSQFTSTLTSQSTSTSRSTITRRASTSTRTSATTTKRKTTEKCSPTPGVARRATGGWDYIKVEGESNCVPVLDFFCVPDLLDQMCTSMCQGIRDQRNINPQNVLSDTAILLHRRMGRNAAAGCANKGCAQRLTYAPLYGEYFSMQCDEFPPASSLEGGGPTITCISWYQNNLGGVFLRYFYDDVGLNRAGLPYVIRMNTCDFPATPVSYARGSEPRPHPKRETATVKAAEKPLWVRDPRGKGEGFVVMPLENSTPGTYNGTLTLLNTDKLKEIAILDSAGDVVWEGKNVSFAGGKINGLQYKVVDETQDLFVAARAESSVEVSAEFTATSVPQPTGSSGAGALKGYVPGVVVGVVFAVVWG